MRVSPTASSVDINAAIQSMARSGGGVVEVPAGRHVVTSPIVLASDVIVRGDSVGGTRYVMDHSSGQHGPCFTKPDGAAITRFVVERGTVDFTACGCPSPHPDDVGVAFPHTAGSAWMFEVSDLTIQYAHHAWNAQFEVFMGRVSRVWSLWCRNGFRHHTGTTMSFDQCFARGGIDAPCGPVPGIGWHLSEIVGATLTGCACDLWQADHPILIEYVRGLTVQGFDAEKNVTLGGDGDALVVLRDSQVAWTGGGWVKNTITAPAGGRAAMMLVDGGQVSLSGVALGGDPRANADRCAGAGEAVTLLVSGPATTAVSLSGCACWPLTPADGFSGTTRAALSVAEQGTHLTFASCQGIGGGIEVWDDYPNLILRHRDGSLGLRLHRAKGHITVIDAALPVAYRDEMGRDVLWLSREHAFIPALSGKSGTVQIDPATGELIIGA